MRTTFIKILEERAKIDKNLFLLTADLGFKLFDNFRKNFSNKFINVGVAEANMIGVAAGLALSGKNVYCYSMVPFLTMRALEQIKVDLCYQNLNVKLIGVGGGLWYGDEGVSHHAIEDISIMRSLPNMTVVCPGDPLEVAAVIGASFEHKGPMFIRLAGNNDKAVHKKIKNFEIGRGIVINNGEKITVFVAGSMLYLAREVMRKLKTKRVNVNLISIHTVKPLDKKIIRKYAKKSKAIFTIEEHSVIGGLGSAVSEVLLSAGFKGIFKKIALPDRYCVDNGSVEYLRNKNGLNEKEIMKLILRNIKNIAKRKK